MSVSQQTNKQTGLFLVHTKASVDLAIFPLHYFSYDILANQRIGTSTIWALHSLRHAALDDVGDRERGKSSIFTEWFSLEMTQVVSTHMSLAMPKFKRVGTYNAWKERRFGLNGDH